MMNEAIAVTSITIEPYIWDSARGWMTVKVAGRYWRGAKGNIRRFKSVDHAKRAIERLFAGR